MTEAPRLPPRALAIAQAVAAKHDVTLRDLTGPSRYKTHCRARFEFWARLYTLRTSGGHPAYSLTRIGRLCGRDHTTVLAGIRRYQETSNDDDPLGVLEGDALSIRRDELLGRVEALQGLLTECFAELSRIDCQITGQSTLPLEVAA